MKAVEIASFVLCTLLVLQVAIAFPFAEEQDIIDPDFSYQPHNGAHKHSKNKDIVVDYTMSANAEMEIPETAAAGIVEAILNLFMHSDIKGNAEVEQNVQVPSEPEQQPEHQSHSRSKRATCDILSATGIQSTACAAHCILLGHKGGYCSAKLVCTCRN